MGGVAELPSCSAPVDGAISPGLKLVIGPGEHSLVFHSRSAGPCVLSAAWGSMAIVGREIEPFGQRQRREDFEFVRFEPFDPYLSDSVA